jgi:hypothetical protein
MAEEKSELEQYQERYAVAAHAMQSGVKATMQMENAAGLDAPDSIFESAHSPKHLRVGVNSMMVDSSALALLLIEKGVITKLEYAKAIAEGMENEVKCYEESLTHYYGRKITLR